MDREERQPHMNCGMGMSINMSGSEATEGVGTDDRSTEWQGSKITLTISPPRDAIPVHRRSIHRWNGQ